MQFDGVLERLPLFVGGTVQTLWLSTTAFALALLIGLCLALARLSRRKSLSLGSRMITDLVRGIPALVLVLLIYFGLPQIGFDLGSALSGIIALGVNSGAYVGEAFRAGIQTVDVGQTEAARSLGMSHAQAMRRVVLPQAIRIVVPPVTNESTVLIKGTSLLSVISITELTRVGTQVMTLTFRPIEAFLTVGLIYLVINTIVSQASLRLERRLAVPGS
ncbi:MAG: amino acid ABC transporter permease [Candidatus Limnocylindrales bacterium]